MPRAGEAILIATHTSMERSRIRLTAGWFAGVDSTRAGGEADGQTIARSAKTGSLVHAK